MADPRTQNEIIKMLKKTLIDFFVTIIVSSLQGILDFKRREEENLKGEINSPERHHIGIFW
jgi:hypothetical protein